MNFVGFPPPHRTLILGEGGQRKCKSGFHFFCCLHKEWSSSSRPSQVPFLISHIRSSKVRRYCALPLPLHPLVPPTSATSRDARIVGASFSVRTGSTGANVKHVVEHPYASMPVGDRSAKNVMVHPFAYTIASASLVNNAWAVPSAHMTARNTPARSARVVLFAYTIASATIVANAPPHHSVFMEI